jgi:hypothetical protein
MVAVLRAVVPPYSSTMAAGAAALQLLEAVIFGAMVYAVAMTLLWLAARRPQSVERLVFERVHLALIALTAARRRKVPNA